MKDKNALRHIKSRLKQNPHLQQTYLIEKENDYTACKIRECRKRAKLTQKKLAQLIGTKQSVIARLENAEYKGHSLPMLKKIATALHEPIENFLWSEDRNDGVFYLDTPQIISEAASFNKWKSSEIVIRYSHVK